MVDSKRAQSTLRANPLGHPTLEFFLIDELASVGCFIPLLDFLPHVDVVLDLFERGVFRKRVGGLLLWAYLVGIGASAGGLEAGVSSAARDGMHQDPR